MLATVIVTTTSIIFVLAIIAFVITMVYFYIKDKATDKRLAETNAYMRKQMLYQKCIMNSKGKHYAIPTR